LEMSEDLAVAGRLRQHHDLDPAGRSKRGNDSRMAARSGSVSLLEGEATIEVSSTSRLIPASCSAARVSAAFISHPLEMLKPCCLVRLVRLTLVFPMVSVGGLCIPVRLVRLGQTDQADKTDKTHTSRTSPQRVALS
jgi:hypothetical protein